MAEPAIILFLNRRQYQHNRYRVADFHPFLPHRLDACSIWAERLCGYAVPPGITYSPLPTCWPMDEEGMRNLKEAAAVWHGPLRPDQHDRAFGIGEAEDENLGHEFADLLRREIDDRCDLPADQRGCVVMAGALRRGTSEPEFRSEIDRHLQGGPARLRKRLGRDDRADPYLDFLELVEADRHRRSRNRDWLRQR